MALDFVFSGITQVDSNYWVRSCGWKKKKKKEEKPLAMNNLCHDIDMKSCL